MKVTLWRVRKNSRPARTCPARCNTVKASPTPAWAGTTRCRREQFLRLECEPLRASGKVLTADKVLTVASAAGAQLLSDPVWSLEFARAASAALAKAVVRVDVPAMAISY